jgi:hypothetical protein
MCQKKISKDLQGVKKGLFWELFRTFFKSMKINHLDFKLAVWRNKRRRLVPNLKFLVFMKGVKIE